MSHTRISSALAKTAKQIIERSKAVVGCGLAEGMHEVIERTIDGAITGYAAVSLLEVTLMDCSGDSYRESYLNDHAATNDQRAFRTLQFDAANYGREHALNDYANDVLTGAITGMLIGFGYGFFKGAARGLTTPLPLQENTPAHKI
jgi:hypothetical protein